MFKKKVEEKPQIDQYKINYLLKNCKKEIEGYLNNYGATIDATIAKLTNAKRDQRFAEADRLKDRLRNFLVKQEEMQKLVDTVEDFEFKINDAFAKIAICNSMSEVTAELGKIDLNIDLKKMLKQFNSFSENMKDQFEVVDTVMKSIDSKMSKIDSSKDAKLNSEIDNIVNQRLAQYDLQTTNAAENITSFENDELKLK